MIDGQYGLHQVRPIRCHRANYESSELFWIDERTAGQARDAFVTRLHVRYDREHFPEDLVCHQTGDRTNFHGRYVLRHAWKGGEAGDAIGSCPEARSYLSSLSTRYEREAQTLANLTGWDVDDIRRRMGFDGTIPTTAEPEKWWRRLWHSAGLLFAPRLQR